ncbi:CDP-alcohol phosphatidyltransferase family protein [Bdellovibrionota bacterium]
MTIPNVISIIRIILAPVVLLLIIKQNFSVALFIFMVAGISDLIDGYLARRLHQRSVLGSYLDPAADKLLIVMCVSYFVVVGEAPWWWLGIIFLREIMLGTGVLLLKNFRAPCEIFPTAFGKSSTALNMIAIMGLMISHLMSVPRIILFMLILVASTLTFISFVQYSLKWFEFYSQRNGGNPGADL